MDVYCQLHPAKKISLYCESCRQVCCSKCQQEFHKDKHEILGVDILKERAEQAIEEIQKSIERVEFKLLKMNDQSQQLIKALKIQLDLLANLVENFEFQNQTQLLKGAKLSNPERIKKINKKEKSLGQLRIDHGEQLQVLLNKYAEQIENADITVAVRILDSILFLDPHNFIYQKEMERLKVLQSEKQIIPPLSQPSIKKPEEPIESKQAITLFKQEKYEEALKAFQKIIDQDGDQYQMQYYAGSCLYKLQKYMESLDYFELSLGLKPEDNFDALFGKCQSLYEMKFQQDLDIGYQMMKQQYQEYPGTLLVQGQLLLLKKNYEQALQCFETLLQLEKNYYDAIFYKSQTLIILRRDLHEAKNDIFHLTEAQYDRRKIQQIKIELENVKQFR